jgi:hypothetical protein
MDRGRRGEWSLLDTVYVQRRHGNESTLCITCIYDTIHLLHAGEGNMKIYSPKSIILFREIKIIFHPLGSLAEFIVLWQENVRGTRNASFAGDRYNVVFKYLRQRSNELKICLPAVFTIHLLHAGEGNMKIYSPKSIIFPEGNARGEMILMGE